MICVNSTVGVVKNEGSGIAGCKLYESLFMLKKIIQCSVLDVEVEIYGTSL